MSTTVFKVIAIISMLIDHIAASGLIPLSSPCYTVCRVIGRLAFPLFCFCIAEGLRHSKNRKRYIIRLFVFALISEVPFDLLFHKTFFTWDGQNVIFTLLLAVVGITVFEQPDLLVKMMQKFEKNPNTYAYQNADWVMKSFILGICALLGYLLKTDYAWFGVCLVYVIYFTGRWSKPKRYATIATYIIGYGLIQTLAGSGMMTTLYWFAASTSLILIMLYNNKKGKDLKWLFYIFYPAHMLILYLIIQYNLIEEIALIIRMF